jgi:PST family polysaccharide transporter
VSPPHDLIDHVQPSSLKRISVRGGGVTIVAQGLRFLIRLTAQVALARFLVPSDYGLIAMVAPVIALVQLMGDLGLGQAVVQRAEIGPAQLSSLFWLGLAINLVVALLVALISPLVAELYREPRLVLISIALAGLIPISGMSTLPAALMSRNLRFGVLAFLDVAPLAAGLMSGLAAAWCGWGYWSLIVSMASESFFAGCLAWLMSTWRPKFTGFDKSALSILRIGGHITGFNLAQYLTTTADNILIAATQGAVALGLYDKGYKIVAQPVGQLITPTSRIAVPLLVRLLTEPDRYKNAYLSMLQVMLLFGVPGIIFVMVMSKPLMTILLGNRWDGIAPIVSWLCFGSLASPLNSSTGWLFISQGRAKQQLQYGLFTSVISVASFAAGLPWGPVGVAAGAGLSFFFLSTPLTCWGATRTGPVNFNDLLFAILPLFVSSSFTAIALIAISKVFLVEDNPGYLFFAMIAAPITFFSVLVCFQNGRSILQKTWRLRTALKAEGTSPATIEAALPF